MTTSTLPPNSTATPEHLPSRLGDAKKVGTRLGMSWRTVYRYADSGLMPWGIKIGTLRRWDMDEIERWIGQGCRPVRQPGKAAQHNGRVCEARP
jgi:predicted DNA-binding transcriptional regulator AlpA